LNPNEPKQTEEQPKQCDREHILIFFQKIEGCSSLFQNSLFRLFRYYTETERFGVSNELKQTEDHPKQFDREHILAFYGKFRVVSVSFETVLFFFSCFNIGSKHRNKTKQIEIFCFWFHGTNQNTTETDFVLLKGTGKWSVSFESSLL
jgi:hypothetical protein